VITLEDAEISEYFNHPNLILAPDRHYCNGSLASLLQSKPANRRRWLRRVRRSRASMLQEHQQRQLQITQFFNPLKTNTQRPALDSTEITETVHGHHDLQDINRPKVHSQYHQQAKLTHFFPGRPPDTQLIYGVSLQSPAP
jgi:hypothetical protein